MTTTGAAAAFKGYSAQTLFILHSVLCDNNDYIFKPEDEEDLTICDKNNTIIEVVQIKDLKQDLCLSNFGSDFFDSRLPKYLENKIPIRFLSFGNIGPELLRLSKGDNFERKTIIARLIKKGYTIDEAELFLDLLIIEKVEKGQLRKDVKDKIINETPGALQENFAYELLTQWIYQASAEKFPLTNLDIRNKITDSIVALNKAYSFLETIGHNIRKIFDDSLIPCEMAVEDFNRLNEEFLLGMSVKKDHILANVDLKREDKLKLVNEAFQSSNIVIVHGASGQGKSCLAYRYLYDYCITPYEISNYNASNIGYIIQALKSLAYKDLNVTIPFYIDVIPGQNEWVNIVTELASYSKNFKILITIREEEWNSTVLPRYEINFNEIALKFDKDEAIKIFNKIEYQSEISDLPSFEDAWLEFGESGPLLEFVYLLNHGDRLEDRLYSQISNLTKNEEYLLEVISFACQYSTTIDTRKLYDLSKLDKVSFLSTLEKFNQEHFIRVVDKNCVAALHPIRATLISKLLYSELSDNEELAYKCLNILTESHYELFLKNYFHENNFSSKLDQFLKQKEYESYEGICGVVRAYLWNGMKQYISINDNLIKSQIEEFGKSWQLLFPFDFCNNDECSTCAGIFKDSSPELYNKGLDVEKKISSKSIIFTNSKSYLESVSLVKDYKNKNDDHLNSFSEFLYWLGLLDIEKNIQFENYELKNFSVKSIATFFCGLYNYSGDQFLNYLDTRVSIKERFQLEYQIPLIEEKDDEVTLYCLCVEETNTPHGESNFYNWFIMERVNIARLLFPEKKVFKADSYGYDYEFMGYGFTNQNVSKAIPIENLPLKWSIYLNKYFSGLVEKEYRPTTWLSFFELLAKRLDLYGKVGDKMIRLFLVEPNNFVNEYQKVRAEYVFDLKEMNQLFLLPQNCVDKFSGVTENKSKELITSTPLSMHYHLNFINKTKALFTSLGNVFNQLIEIMGIVCMNDKKKTDRYIHLSKLILWNLKDVILYGYELEKILLRNYSKYSSEWDIKLDLTKYDLLFQLVSDIGSLKKKQCLKNKGKTYDSFDFLTLLKAKLPKILEKKKSSLVQICIVDRRLVIVINTKSINAYFSVVDILIGKIKHVIGQHAFLSSKRINIQKRIDELVVIPLYKSKRIFEEIVYCFEINEIFDNKICIENNIKYIPSREYLLSLNLPVWIDDYEGLGIIQQTLHKLFTFRNTLNVLAQSVVLDDKVNENDFGRGLFEDFYEKESMVLQKDLQFVYEGFNKIPALLKVFNDDLVYRICDISNWQKISLFIDGLIPTDIEKDEEGKRSVSVTPNELTNLAMKMNNIIPQTIQTLVVLITSLLAVYEKDVIFKEYFDELES